MEQRITIPVSRPVSRATRRRLQRKQTTFQPSAEVQIVELRRRERPHQQQSDQDDRGPPEWHENRGPSYKQIGSCSHTSPIGQGKLSAVKVYSGRV